MMHYHEFRAMNTTVLMAAEGDYARALEGFRAAEEQVRRHEQRFTRFAETSELSALNRSAGQWFLASPEMYAVVRLAFSCYRETGGLFNPGILAALEQAGYDRSMDEIRLLGSVDARAGGSPWPGPDFGRTAFDSANLAIRLPAGLRVDLGGIAKGWIAEQAAHLLGGYAEACVVDAGGDLCAIGLPADGQGWIVAIEDPFDPSRDLTILRVGPGAVATSTTTRRRWKQAGQERHHLIDPRTGYPAQAFWASVTVVAGHTAQAEALAKALLIAGPDGADALTRTHPDAAFLAADQNGKLWGSENSQEVLYDHVR